MRDFSITEFKNSGISLIYLGYRDTSQFKVGQKVNVWIKGGINDSSPQQAAAQKIEIID